MKVTLTNKGTVAVPFSSSQDKGFATMLEPNTPYELNSTAVTVANVGDNPSASEEFAEGISSLWNKLVDLITFWREHTQKESAVSGAVHVLIDNKGANALRVLLGSNMNEVHVSPGTTHDATAAEYIELRELGV